MNDIIFDEEETKVITLSQLAVLLGKSEADLMKEKIEKEVHDEFWSDICWTE